MRSKMNSKRKLYIAIMLLVLLLITLLVIKYTNNSEKNYKYDTVYVYNKTQNKKSIMYKKELTFRDDVYLIEANENDILNVVLCETYFRYNPRENYRTLNLVSFKSNNKKKILEEENLLLYSNHCVQSKDLKVQHIEKQFVEINTFLERDKLPPHFDADRNSLGSKMDRFVISKSAKLWSTKIDKFLIEIDRYIKSFSDSRLKDNIEFIRDKEFPEDRNIFYIHSHESLQEELKKGGFFKEKHDD